MREVTAWLLAGNMVQQRTGVRRMMLSWSGRSRCPMAARIWWTLRLVRS